MISEEEQSIPKDKLYAAQRLEDVLLERLRSEPDIKPQIPLSRLIAIIGAIAGAAAILFFVFRTPDTFAPAEPVEQQNPHTAQIDSSELRSKRLRYAGLIDSLEALHAAEPDNSKASMYLANAYYDVEFWDKAISLYEVYLKKHPEEVDVRVDYAYSIAQQNGDFKRAVQELEKALSYKPNHVNALFNAGILSLRANMSNKELAVKTARKYFFRAQKAAEGVNPQMSEQIKKVLAEIDRIEKGGEIPQ